MDDYYLNPENVLDGLYPSVFNNKLFLAFVMGWFYFHDKNTFKKTPKRRNLILTASRYARRHQLTMRLSSIGMDMYGSGAEIPFQRNI